MLDSKPKPLSVAIVNWDGVLTPPAASPRQIFLALCSFAELYTFQQTWILTLPVWLQPRTRAALALAYLPQVLALYNSRSMSQLIQQFKLGQITETVFFQAILNRHFAFLTQIPNLRKTPLELIRDAWCYPRLQPMSTLEKARLHHLLEKFDKIFLIANSNTADIRVFIKNLLRDPQMQTQFPDAPKILERLSQHTANPSVLLSNLFKLSEQVGMLTSAQTDQFKVMGNPRQRPNGFLAELLKAYKQAAITVISDVPSDRNAARSLAAANCNINTSDEFFNDRHTWQKIRGSLNDNWPLLAILLFVIALLYCFSYFNLL